jgi:TolA-binding protein
MESIKNRPVLRLSFALLIFTGLLLGACSTTTRNPKDGPSKPQNELTLLKEQLRRAQMKIKKLEAKIAQTGSKKKSKENISFAHPQTNKQYASALAKVNAWMEEGLFSEAIAYLEKLIQSDSTQALSSRAHFFLGLNYLKTNQIQKAQEQFEKIIRKFPSSGVTAHSVHYLSQIHQNKENSQLATSYKNLLKEIYPGSPEMNAASGQRSFVLQEDNKDSL